MEFILGNVVALFQIFWNQIYMRIMLYEIYLRYCCSVIALFWNQIYMRHVWMNYTTKLFDKALKHFEQFLWTKDLPLLHFGTTGYINYAGNQHKFYPYKTAVLWDCINYVAIRNIFFPHFNSMHTELINMYQPTQNAHVQSIVNYSYIKHVR